MPDVWVIGKSRTILPKVLGPCSIALALALLLALATPPATAHAATIAVSTTADELNSNGNCSLREAIHAANTNAVVDACIAGSGGTDTITLLAETYTLTIGGTGEESNVTGDLDILGDLTINGAGSASTVIDGGGIDRVLHILSAVTATIDGVTITNGSTTSAGGGGILNDGTLTLTTSTVSGNTAANWAGGIRNDGSLVLSGSAVSGNTASNGQGGGILNADAGTQIILTDSTVSGNTASLGAGGIFNYGTVTLTNTTIGDNMAVNGDGGGIVNAIAGTLTLTDSTVSGNTAGWGGGIRNDGSLVLSGSAVSGNTASNGQGGGIVNANAGALLTLTDSTVSGNTASLGAGGIFNYGTVTLTNTTIGDNMAVNGDGGGIVNAIAGTLTLTDSTVSGNTAGWGGGIRNDGSLVLSGSAVSGNTANNGQGGGIVNANAGALLTLTDSTVGGNTASLGAAGIFNYGTVTLTNTTISDNMAVNGDGGGIVNNSGTLTLTDSTVSGNTATWGGGIRNDGSLVLSGSTVSGNIANIGDGGGILNANACTLTLTNSTVSGNTAAWGGGIRNGGSLVLSGSTVSGNTASNGQGGGIQDVSGSANIKNSIVAGNTAGGPGPDCSGSLTSLGYNLVQDTSGCTIAGDLTRNITGQAPLLGPLQDNGGPTLTHALLLGSPAIDAGNPATPGSGGDACEATDQRLAPRPAGAACDIGAYEANSLPLGEVPSISQWALIGLAVLLALLASVRLARRSLREPA